MRTRLQERSPQVILIFGSPDPPGKAPKPAGQRSADDSPHTEQTEDPGLRWMRSCPVCFKRLVRQWPWKPVYCTCGWEWKG